MLGFGLKGHPTSEPGFDNPYWMQESERRALSMDGVNDTTLLGNFDDIDGQSQLSFSFWFKIKSTPAGSTPFLFHLADPTVQNFLHSLFDYRTMAVGGGANVMLPQIMIFDPYVTGGGATIAPMLGLYRQSAGAGSVRTDYGRDFSSGGNGLNKWWCMQFKWSKTQDSGKKYIRICGPYRQNDDINPNDTGLEGNWTQVGTTTTGNLSFPTGQYSAIGCYYVTALGTTATYLNANFAEFGIWNRRLGDEEFDALARGHKPEEFQTSSLLHYWTFNNTNEDFGSASTRDESDATLSGSTYELI